MCICRAEIALAAASMAAVGAALFTVAGEKDLSKLWLVCAVQFWTALRAGAS